MFITRLGTVFCGLVIGWISYRTIRLTAVITLLKDEVMFGWYAIGLIIGFLVSFAIGLGSYGKQELQLWQIPPAAAPITPFDAPPDAGNGE